MIQQYYKGKDEKWYSAEMRPDYEYYNIHEYLLYLELPNKDRQITHGYFVEYGSGEGGYWSVPHIACDPCFEQEWVKAWKYPYINLSKVEGGIKE